MSAPLRRFVVPSRPSSLRAALVFGVSWGVGVLAGCELVGGDTSSSSSQSMGTESSTAATGERGACDLWQQDCEAGEKCAPHVQGDAAVWNAARCIPDSPRPRPVGATCTAIPYGSDDRDDCVDGALCWFGDDGRSGRCVATCPAGGTCAGALEQCVAFTWSNLGVGLCLPGCHPLEDPCPTGQSCVPSGPAFACAASVGKRELGEACVVPSDCGQGAGCVEAAYVSMCREGGRCCAPYCDTKDASPCPKGTTCVREASATAEGYETLGICRSGG